MIRIILLAKGLLLLESVEGFINAYWHWYVSMFSLVIPLDGECRIKFPIPIDYYFVKICVLLSNILDFKVIRSKGEVYGYGFMGPESWSEC